MSDDLLPTGSDIDTTDIDTSDAVADVDAPDSDITTDSGDVAEFDLTADASDDADGDVEPVDHPWTRPGRWYVVHTQSGYEKKVLANLAARSYPVDEHGGARSTRSSSPWKKSTSSRTVASRPCRRRSSPATCWSVVEMNDDSWYCIRKHPRCHRLRGPEQARAEAHAPVASGSADTFLAGQGRWHGQDMHHTARSPSSTTRWARAFGCKRRPVRRFRRPRSLRSMPTT